MVEDKIILACDDLYRIAVLFVCEGGMQFKRTMSSSGWLKAADKSNEDATWNDPLTSIWDDDW